MNFEPMCDGALVTCSELVWQLGRSQPRLFLAEALNKLTHRFAFIKQHGLSFEQAAAARQAAGSDHNQREAPLFAKSIERKALAH